jgi:hypothetical protein
MTRNPSFGKQKAMRTQITDLPEIAVELSEREMRIVSGGLTSTARACSAFITQIGGNMRPRTQYNTSGDWDTDW